VEDLAPRVTPAERRRGIGSRLAVYLEDLVDQVEDPVVLEASPGVDAPLALPVAAEARLCHLDGEDGAGGVRAAIVVRAAGSHGHVGLGFGLIVEADGSLRRHHPARAERRLERLRGP